MSIRFNWDRFIEFLTKILLILSLAFALAIGINSYLSYKFFNLNKIVKVQHRQKKMNNNLKYSYLNYIFEKNLKKNNLTKTKKEKVIQVTLEDLNLKIKLIGTAISSKEKVAFIQDREGLKLIKPGDNLGKFKVKRIDRFSITLTDGINDYYILLSVSSSKSKYRRNRYTHNYNKHVIEPQSTSSHYEISKREVEKQTEDLGKLLRYVRIVPVVRGGETKGYKFAYVSPRSILYKYGLRSGDIIISVNGMPVRTAEEAFKIYNMLRNETNIRLEVERRGERKIITYEIK